jgi:hypothetical protein
MLQHYRTFHISHMVYPATRLRWSNLMRRSALSVGKTSVSLTLEVGVIAAPTHCMEDTLGEGVWLRSASS